MVLARRSEDSACSVVRICSAIFRQRIDERVREETDHLVDELTRVARERGMQ